MTRWVSILLLLATLLLRPSFATAGEKPPMTALQWARRTFELAFNTGRALLGHRQVISPLEGARPAVTVAPKFAVTAAPKSAVTTAPKSAVPPRPIDYRGQMVVLGNEGGPRSTYRLGNELGHGKWSVTHEATDLATGRRMAIKLTKPSRLDVGHVDNFSEEAGRLSKVTHRNVMTMRGLGTLDGTPQRALVMDFVPGQTVGELFNQRVKTPRGQAVRIAMQILEGAEAIHAAGMIHKSFHVGNVMYAPGQAGVRESVKIIDLGGSKDISETHTPHKDRKDIGTLLAFMLTGAKGYRGGQWPELSAALAVLPDITVVRNEKVLRLRDVILKATNPDPAQSFQSDREFMEALKPFQKRAQWKIGPKKDVE